ncbi:hypothetical protein [Bacillus sp. MYb209]|uniref:hypothetical protein n=1 Tax=Bacillus sp. MYb209 TaxID=1848605 RepID=UPI0015E46906|nr:hypothetical protein [Bacillus sp. MYb209]
MKSVKGITILTAVCESVLGIPFLGGILVVASFWSALWIMLVAHIVALIIAHQSGASKLGSIMGIVASILGFIPFVGMILHIVTAIILWLEVASMGNREEVIKLMFILASPIGIILMINWAQETFNPRTWRVDIGT